jgi:hypothetical protein
MAGLLWGVPEFAPKFPNSYWVFLTSDTNDDRVLICKLAEGVPGAPEKRVPVSDGCSEVNIIVKSAFVFITVGSVT